MSMRGAFAAQMHDEALLDIRQMQILEKSPHSCCSIPTLNAHSLTGHSWALNPQLHQRCPDDWSCARLGNEDGVPRTPVRAGGHNVEAGRTFMHTSHDECAVQSVKVVQTR
jgi:hypothetical protein